MFTCAIWNKSITSYEEMAEITFGCMKRPWLVRNYA
jgi:hypothetical protein